MKRLFALLLAIAVLCALLCACDEKTTVSSTIDKKTTVTTTVDAKYDDGYAEDFAKSVTTDKAGNKVYEFENEQYEKYIKEHNNVLSGDIMKNIAAQHKDSYGEFAYINDEKRAVIVGVHTDKYDETIAKKEADSVAEYGLKYFQSLESPVETIKVIYCNASNQNTILGTFEYSVE